jgi:low affinity Fe/Cu permease
MFGWTIAAGGREMSNMFSQFAVRVARMAGHYVAFILAVGVICVWLLTGPVFGFSDTWQLVVNTGTSITTFLMVFLIQNSQNRDMRAIQLKLDELIRSSEAADNRLIDAEEDSEEELDSLQAGYAQLAHELRLLKQHMSATDGDSATPSR